MMIQVRDLARTYQMGDIEVHALRGVSFDIACSELVAIMGPSGSGKSTLMNVLGCVDTPTAGRYLLDGLSIELLDKDAIAAVRNRVLTLRDGLLASDVLQTQGVDGEHP